MNTASLFKKCDCIEWEMAGEGVKRKIMVYNNDLMMVKVAFCKGSVGSLHQHRHSQVTHVDEGSFEVQIGDDKKELNKGDVFFIPPNVIHGVVCLEEGILIDVFNPMREDFIAE